MQWRDSRMFDPIANPCVGVMSHMLSLTADQSVLDARRVTNSERMAFFWIPTPVAADDHKDQKVRSKSYALNTQQQSMPIYEAFRAGDAPPGVLNASEGLHGVVQYQLNTTIFTKQQWSYFYYPFDSQVIRFHFLVQEPLALCPHSDLITYRVCSSKRVRVEAHLRPRLLATPICANVRAAAPTHMCAGLAFYSLLAGLQRNDMRHGSFLQRNFHRPVAAARVRVMPVALPYLPNSLTHSGYYSPPYLTSQRSRPFTHSPTHSPTHPLTQSFTHPPTHSLTHSLTHPLTHSPTHPLTHSPTHPLTHSPTHPLTHSPPTHPLTHSPTHQKRQHDSSRYATESKELLLNLPPNFNCSCDCGGG